MIDLLRTFALSLAVLFTCLLCIFLTLLYFLQEKLVFVPGTLPEGYVFQFAQVFQERVFEFEGARIDTLHFDGAPPQAVRGDRGATDGLKPPQPLILYFHGNAGQLASWGEVAQMLAVKTGAAVWVIDYPGYGKSTGSISSETQLERLAEKFYKMGAAEALSQHRSLVIYGRSIGTGLASKLAADHSHEAIFAGLILEAPFFNFLQLARRTVPFVPEFVLQYHFPSNQRLATVVKPVLIVHGTEDETIPVHHSEALVKRSLPSARLVEIPGGKHNDLSNSPLYWSAIEGFVADLGQSVAPPKSGQETATRAKK